MLVRTQNNTQKHMLANTISYGLKHMKAFTLLTILAAGIKIIRKTM